MFTIFANYLLGRQQVYEQEITDERLTTLEADDADWLLIDKTTAPVDNDSDSDDSLDGFAFEYIPSLDEYVPSLKEYAPSIEKYVPSLDASPTDYHEPMFPMEESWFLTPPPCFTSAGPIFVETSPLENLLIEHPSMSVYQHSTAPRMASYRHPSPHGSVTSDRDGRRAVEVAPPRRLTAVLLGHVCQEGQNSRAASAQKTRQCHDNLTLKRNKLVRTNKARENNSARNKRPRRSDRQRKHSGANNNRKC